MPGILLGALNALGTKQLSPPTGSLHFSWRNTDKKQTNPKNIIKRQL